MQLYDNLPILVQQQPMTQAEAITTLKPMIKLQWVAQQMGISSSNFTFAVKGHSPNGKPFHLSPERVRMFNKVLLNLAHHLMQTRIERDIISQNSGKLAWGDTPLIQIHHLDEAINIRYLFVDEMGWTKPMYNQRLRQRTTSTYGIIRDDHLKAINLALPRIAIRLMQIQMQEHAGAVQENL